ncbi:hypothetical protein [Streptomyces thermolilacinus]|uniref:hypothetical protein n=1 Tax=Streptomyces thermolilacinus TaxID=285540 RepID=UPI0033EE0D03
MLLAPAQAGAPWAVPAPRAVRDGSYRLPGHRTGRYGSGPVPPGSYPADLARTG